jgi:hypothetical protein
MAVRIPRKVRQRPPRQLPLQRPRPLLLQRQLIHVLLTHVAQTARILVNATLVVAIAAVPVAEMNWNATIVYTSLANRDAHMYATATLVVLPRVLQGVLIIMSLNFAGHNQSRLEPHVCIRTLISPTSRFPLLPSFVGFASTEPSNSRISRKMRLDWNTIRMLCGDIRSLSRLDSLNSIHAQSTCTCA